MSPAELRQFLTDLPWKDYTRGELNEIASIAMSLSVTCRNQRAENHRALMAEEMAKRPRITEVQLTKEQVYPVGSRLE